MNLQGEKKRITKFIPIIVVSLLLWVLVILSIRSCLVLWDDHDRIIAMEVRMKQQEAYTEYLTRKGVEQWKWNQKMSNSLRKKGWWE